MAMMAQTMMAQTSTRGRGRVLTFYSYKGGTGRTMAMANVAWILASNGYKVLAIDWDLEAPGLHRFLGPALTDPDQSKQEGLLDFLTEYIVEATRATDDDGDPSTPWYDAFTNLARFAQPVDTRFPKGRLDMIGAGRQNAGYAKLVNTFDWHAFYDKFRGGAFLDATFKELRESYDYILIDSRTGVSDTSGICTIQLPDVLVVMFTLNTQSIVGASSVAADALKQRDHAIKVVPVPTRVEISEFDRLQAAREAAVRHFAPTVSGRAADEYLEEMEVRHVPYYLYGEQLAAVVEAGRARILLSNYEKLCEVATGEVSRLQLLPADELEAARTRFKSGSVAGAGASTGASDTTAKAAAKWDIFLSYARGDLELARKFRRELSDFATVYLDLDSVSPGDNVEASTAAALASTPIFVALVTKEWLDSKAAQGDLDEARKAKRRLVPVLVETAEAPASMQGLRPLRLEAVSEPQLRAAAERLRTVVEEVRGATRSPAEEKALLVASRDALKEQLNDTKRSRRFAIQLYIAATLGFVVVLVLWLTGVRLGGGGDRELNQATARAVTAEKNLLEVEGALGRTASYGARYALECERDTANALKKLVQLETSSKCNNADCKHVLDEVTYAQRLVTDSTGARMNTMRNDWARICPSPDPLQQRPPQEQALPRTALTRPRECALYDHLNELVDPIFPPTNGPAMPPDQPRPAP